MNPAKMKENSLKRANEPCPPINTNVTNISLRDQEPMSPTKYDLRVRKKRTESLSSVKKLPKDGRPPYMTRSNSQTAVLMEEIENDDETRESVIEEETLSLSKSVLLNSETEIENFQPSTLTPSETMDLLQPPNCDTMLYHGGLLPLERSLSQVRREDLFKDDPWFMWFI
jgi:hypothetical protein